MKKKTAFPFNNILHLLRLGCTVNKKKKAIFKNIFITVVSTTKIQITSVNTTI